MNDYDHTPLMSATSTFGDRNREVIKILVKYKAQINLMSQQKFSALHCASKHGSSEVIDLLLHKGADVNCVDLKGNTPLEHASYCLNANAIHSLLKFHADPNRQDQHGRTTLHLIGRFVSGLFFCKVEKCLMLLLSNGANINIQNRNGETPLSYTVRRCLLGPCNDHRRRVRLHLVKLLLSEKSNIDSRRLKPYGKLVKGDTILHSAVRYMKFDLVQLILHYDPDLRVRNYRQETARDVAKTLDADDDNCIKIIELIEKKMEPIRIQSYSYLIQSWVMPDGEQEQLHNR